VVTNAADETSVSISVFPIFFYYLNSFNDALREFHYKFAWDFIIIRFLNARDNEGFQSVLFGNPINCQNKNQFCELKSHFFIQSMHNKLELELDNDSIFYKLGSSGLITFSDYIFLLTVLSSEYKFDLYSPIFYSYHAQDRCFV